ncbi:GNAT family N-acetyltransferase [Micromonospora chersina]|uniref:GNAT family N-acetyltransferase n=1 Tax=Micromonospora chersina TaxID=47854 RepID=UPI00371500BD
MAVTFHTLGGGQAVYLFPSLVDLYALVYAEPPYEEGPEEVDRFREGLPEESTRPGFSLVAAIDDGVLIGAAYAWTMAAGTWWSRAEHDPPARLRDADKLAVMEWIVRPGYRGRGVGAELMRRLLADRPERYATLASDPRSHARKVYERNGWQEVGKSVLPWGPPMDLLVLDLRREPIQGG